jgi:hypothetical protein
MRVMIGGAAFLARREDCAVPVGEGKYAVQAVRSRDAARHGAMPKLWGAIDKAR